MTCQEILLLLALYLITSGISITNISTVTPARIITAGLFVSSRYLYMLSIIGSNINKKYNIFSILRDFFMKKRRLFGIYTLCHVIFWGKNSISYYEIIDDISDQIANG